MAVATRYVEVKVPQGMSNVKLENKSRTTCQIAVKNVCGDRSQAPGFAVPIAAPPARPNWLQIVVVAAAAVLMVGAVTGCSHSNSTPSASASPAPADSASPTPSASASPTPAVVAQASPNAQPSATPIRINVPMPAPVSRLDSSRIAGVWRNDDPRVKDRNFEFRIIQEGNEVYVKTCDPTRCADNLILTLPLTANDSALFSWGGDQRSRLQVDSAGHLIVLSENRNQKTGVWSVTSTASFHKAG